MFEQELFDLLFANVCTPSHNEILTNHGRGVPDSNPCVLIFTPKMVLKEFLLLDYTFLTLLGSKTALRRVTTPLSSVPVSSSTQAENSPQSKNVLHLKKNQLIRFLTTDHVFILKLTPLLKTIKG